ncbi:MAG: hypothetical protein AAF808_16540 [Cyanobacteria bacterium P01_D01_bin.2]
MANRLKKLFKRPSGRVARSGVENADGKSPTKSGDARPSAPSAVKSVQTAKSQGKSTERLGLWSELFLVRPWLLVGGLWLTSVIMIAIALAGLSNPGRELTIKPVDSSLLGQPLSAPDAAAVSRLAIEDISLAQHDPAATLPGDAEQAMPAWPLLLMVAACAGGCLLMSKQGVLTAQSRRGRRRILGQPTKPRPTRPASSGRHRRSKHRRLGSQRPASQVMAFRTGQRTIQHTSPQRSPVQPVSFNVEPARPVAVVPTHETSPLDWKEGSLAHRLDVRQSRSINSFL